MYCTLPASAHGRSDLAANMNSLSLQQQQMRSLDPQNSSSSGWIQVRVVSGSNDTLWWSVACHPLTETVGELRQRLVKGSGNYVPTLYHNGKALPEATRLQDAGIDATSVLSTGHGASLVYGKKAAASFNKVRDSGYHVMDDQTAKQKRDEIDKPAWSHAQPKYDDYKKDDLQRSSRPTSASRNALQTTARGVQPKGRASLPNDVSRRQRSASVASSCSSSSSSSSSSSGSDHSEASCVKCSCRWRQRNDAAQQQEKSFLSKVAEATERDAEKKFTAHINELWDSLCAPDYRRLLCRCRCHNGSAGGARGPSERKRRHSSKKRAASQRRSSSSLSSRRRSRAADNSPAMIMPVAVCQCGNEPVLFPVSAAELVPQKKDPVGRLVRRDQTSGGGFVRGSTDRAKQSSVQSRSPSRRAASPAEARAKTATTVSVSQVLDGILPQGVKHIRDIVPQLGSTPAEQSVAVEKLQHELEVVRKDKEALEAKLGIMSTKAPLRKGLVTPPFPLSGDPNVMFTYDTHDDVNNTKPPTQQQQGLCSMRPSGLSRVDGSAYTPMSQVEIQTMAHNMNFTPHYIFYGVPSGIYPYAAPSQWVSSMPASARPYLESTITPTIAAPGLLKVTAPLYPHHHVGSSGIVPL